MLRRIKNLLEHNALWIAIAITVAIAVLSLSVTPKLNLGLNIKSSDKYLHALAYFTLSLSWLFVFRNQIGYRIKFVLFTVLAIYGIILEILQQTLTDNRTADLFDELANVTGILLGLLVFDKFLRWFNSI